MVDEANPLQGRLPAVGLFGVSATFHYVGPALAVMLFGLVAPSGVAWLRIATAAVVLAVWRRPWRTVRRMSRRGLGLLGAMGGVLAVMNVSFYLAIDRLPLGTVGAIEFGGVIVLAALGVRSRRNLVALLLAVGGVLLLADVHLVAEPVGLAFALVNCLGFTAYVVLGHRMAGDGAVSGLDRLSLAMLVGLVMVTPIGLGAVAPQLTDPVVLAAGIAIGVCSSVIPYAIDQVVMARLSRGGFAILL